MSVNFNVDFNFNVVIGIMVFDIILMQSFVSICSSLGLILNLLLQFIIVFCSGNEIGSYKYLLFCYTGIAMISCIIELSLLPMFHPTDAGFFYFSTVHRFPFIVGNYLILIYCVSFALLMQILTLSFIYRYAIICRPSILHWLSFRRNVVLVVLIIIILSGICGYLTFIVLPGDYTLRQFDAVVFNTTGHHSANLSHMGGDLYRNGSWLTPCTVAIVGYSTVMFINTLIIVFCLIRILVFFKGSSKIHFVETIRKAQRRFLILLFLQTLVPTMFTFSPVIISYILCFASLNVPLQIHIIYSCFQPIAQLLEPVLIISFLQEYRNAFVNFFKRKILC